MSDPKPEPAEVALLLANSPNSVIREAISTGKSPEILRELLAVRREWEQDEARKAFHLAIAEFQKRAPIVEKGDKAYDKQYARMDRIWRAVRPITSELGLSVTWQICELKDNGVCHVEGNLGHAHGHSVRLAMDIPIPDLIKGQNKAQQLGSAFTYAQRYAFCASLGIVTGDDDDGNGAGTVFVDDAQTKHITELVDACRGLADFKETAFWSWVGVASAREVPAERFNDVVAALKRKLAAKK
jgi:hypothetical protein